ncbi:molybdopterin-dependent oxidoreductase [Streptomyces europaeiscabiei]
MVGGIGQALLEHKVTDHRDGRIVNADFANYLVPVNADIPDFPARRQPPSPYPRPRTRRAGIGTAPAAGSVLDWRRCGWQPLSRNRHMGQGIAPKTPSAWTRLRRPGPCPVPGSWYRASGQPPGRRATASITYFAAGQRVGSAPSAAGPQTHEQRIQSVQANLTIRHPKKNVSAGQDPAQVGRVGLEPTADGL